MFSVALSLSRKFMLQRKEVESQHSNGQDLRSCQVFRVGVCVISFWSADDFDCFFDFCARFFFELKDRVN